MQIPTAFTVVLQLQPQDLHAYLAMWQGPPYHQTGPREILHWLTSPTPLLAAFCKVVLLTTLTCTQTKCQIEGEKKKEMVS